MVSFTALLATAATFALAVAQVPLAFASVPPYAVAGQTYNVTWGGGDGTPVTLTLRRGDADNLDTIGTIASRVSGYSYAWTVSDQYATASDYALQITQGQSTINYSGRFAIVGGTGTSSLSVSGLTLSTANGTIVTTGVIQTRTSSSVPSMGTGTTMARNTTFSSQSLTSHSSTHSTVTTSGSTSARSTAPSATSSTPAVSNVGASMGSSAAMIMGLVGAIMMFQ